MNTPADNVTRAITAFEGGRELHDQVRLWLLHGLQAHRDNDEPLESALGLNIPPGGAYEKLTTVRRFDARDTAIRALKYWLYQDSSDWDAAGYISQLMNCSASRAALTKHVPAHYLLKQLERHKTPTSQKQIRRILKGDRSC